MKRWLFVALAVAVLLAAAPFALAAGGGKASGHHKFQLVGTVVAADSLTGTVTVQVKAGTRTVKDYLAQHPEAAGQVTLQTTTETWMRVVTEDGCAPASIDQFWTGAKVKAGGWFGPVANVDGSTSVLFTARRLKANVTGVEQPAPVEPPAAVEPTPEPEPDPAL